MLFGFQNELSTYVVASTDVNILTTWWDALPADFNSIVNEKRQADFVDILAIDGLMGCETPVYIFEHPDSDAASKFVEINQIQLISKFAVDDYIERMLKDVNENDPLALIDGDKRTIREINGLDDNDKWDTRTEAEKEQQLKIDKLQQQAGDQLTGNSFSPRPTQSKGSIKIRDIAQDQQGNIDVLARKQKDIGNAEFSGEYDYTFDFDKMDVDAAKQKVFELAAKFDPESDEIIEKIEEIFAKTENLNDQKELAGRIILSLTQNAWHVVQEPINTTSQTEAIETVKERVEIFNGILTQSTIDEMIEVSIANINAPRPQPSDFTFTFNEKLTAAPSMRGAGTPIVNMGVNEQGPNAGAFGVSQAIPYFESFGLTHVSTPIFSYEVSPTDINYKSDIRQALLDYGFIETADNIPEAIVPERDGTMLAPEEFQRYFAGDGTSAVDGTSYNGEAITGKSEKDYATDMEPGFDEKGADLQQHTDLRKVSLDNIMQPWHDYLVKVGLTNSDKIEIGNFAGYVFNDNYRIFTLDANDEIVDDMTYNLEYNGASISEAGNRSVVLTKKNNATGAVLVVKSVDIYKIYKM